MMEFSGVQPPEAIVMYDCETVIGPATMVFILCLN